MEILQRKKHFNKIYDFYITEDFRYLHLSYPNFNGDYRTSVETYNSFFDNLNKYSEVKQIFIETDSMNNLPCNISKFINLEKITVSGSRWWSLSMIYLPQSIKSVSFIEQTNLNERCLVGIEKLTNISYLEIDDFWHITPHFLEYEMIDDAEKDISIPNVSSLKTIIINLNIYNDAINTTWKNFISDSNIFQKIKTRINNINLQKNKLIIQLK